MDEQKKQRKPYATPRLVVYGSIRELTRVSGAGVGRVDDGSNCQGSCAGKRT